MNIIEMIEKANQEKQEVIEASEKLQKKVQDAKEGVHEVIVKVFSELNDGKLISGGYSISANKANIIICGTPIEIIKSEVFQEIERIPDVNVENFIKQRIVTLYRQKLGLTD